MQIVKIPTECPGCKEKLNIELNLFTRQVLSVKMVQTVAGFGKKMVVVNCYKELKGFDKISTWDGAYRGRALKAVGKILHLFRRLEDPIEVAIELIQDTEETARVQEWPAWNLESCVKRAGEWLVKKQGGKKRQ